jgi:hypothetical protein
MVMKPTFKKLQVNDLGNLEHLVAENIAGIEPGLRVIDSRVCLGHAAIDLIALDASESLVLIALDFLADEGLLLRGMDAYSWSLEYPDTLRRLYPMANVSSTRPPRLLFVVERLSDAFVRRIKQLSFLEIDCLEFRHLEVNGASAVYFDLVARLRRAAPVEPPTTSEKAVVPVRTPNRSTTEPPAIARAWRRAGEPRGVQHSAATPTTTEAAPFAPERSAIAATAWAAPAHSGSVETRMVELFGRPSTVEVPSPANLPTETYATEETQEVADAEAAGADMVAEEPALQLESIDATARQGTWQAASVAARVTASPEWEALLHQLGAVIPAPTRAAEFTGHAPEAPAEAPVETDATANEAGEPLYQATHGGSEFGDPGTGEQLVPGAVEAAGPTQTQPAWTTPSTDKVVQPITGRTYFFSQAAKSTTPAEAPEPKPSVAPAAAAATVAPSMVAPAQRVSAPAHHTSAPIRPQPAAPAWPPIAPGPQIVAAAPQAVAMAATTVDPARPTEPEPSRPGLEALSFPKDGLSRQWLEFLNQLGGAK